MIILNPNCSLNEFFEALAAGKRAMLILDYDGTLAPFSADPKQAYPYPGVFERLATLIESEITKVVIISGRDIEGLKMLLPAPVPELWGSHGGERLPKNSSQPTTFAIKPEMEHILMVAAKKAEELSPTLLVEIKPLSIALHWRGKNPSLAEPTRLYWSGLTVDHPFEILSFDGGIELKLKGINKGSAVQQLMDEFPENNLIAYLGDDLTDEFAFKALQNKALRVLVRQEPRPTNADVYIKPPVELLEFIDCWVEAVQRGMHARKK